MTKRSWGTALALGAILALAATWASPARAEGAPVEQASWKEKNDAKQKYVQGKREFDEGKHEAALESFKASYAIVASPNSHLMVARTLAKLDRVVEAYRALDAVAVEAEAASAADAKYKKTAEAARAEQATLKSRLAFLIVDFGAQARVADQVIPPDQWGTPLPFPPGEVEVVVETAAWGEQKHLLVLRAGEETTLTPTAPSETHQAAPTTVATALPEGPPAADAGVSYPTLTFVAAGVGVAGLAAFGVFGLVNNSKYSDLESSCPTRRCPESLSDSAESGRTYQTLANVGLGVGVVGLGSAAALWLLAPRAPNASPAAATATAPALLVSPSGVAIRGRF